MVAGWLVETEITQKRKQRIFPKAFQSLKSEPECGRDAGMKTMR